MSKQSSPVQALQEKRIERGKKRLFIGLTVGTSLLVCLLLGLIWLFPYFGLKSIHPAAPLVFGLVILLCILFVLWFTTGFVLNILFGKTLPFFGPVRGLTVGLFLPLMTLLGRSLGISKTRIRSSFIKVNNEQVASRGRKYAPEELLLLMPHCLQRSDCSRRLTYNIGNCKRCGKCPIAGLLDISELYGISLAIATGGTIARRIVIQNRPKLILAVACERDLSSGIQDTYPLPVYGVLNERPYGPCMNTQVSHTHLKRAIHMFLHPDYLEAAEAGKKAASKPKTLKISPPGAEKTSARG